MLMQASTILLESQVQQSFLLAAHESTLIRSFYLDYLMSSKQKLFMCSALQQSSNYGLEWLCSWYYPVHSTCQAAELKLALPPLVNSKSLHIQPLHPFQSCPSLPLSSPTLSDGVMVCMQMLNADDAILEQAMQTGAALKLASLLHNTGRHRKVIFLPARTLDYHLCTVMFDRSCLLSCLHAVFTA